VSAKHPIIAITGSSGAGTTSIMRTFEQIFRREGVKTPFVEADSFHRYDRAEIKLKVAESIERGNQRFSHFGPEAKLFKELEALFRKYSSTATHGRAPRWGCTPPFWIEGALKLSSSQRLPFYFLARAAFSPTKARRGVGIVAIPMRT
jgi:hypothetical protein